MTILGTGRASGGISILHAVGLGQGCSTGIGLETIVKLTSTPVPIDSDKHSLLESVVIIWNNSGLPLPPSIGWKVTSSIPIGQGLKSSSALACAALLALNEATWAGLSDSEIVDLAVAAQRHSGCTISGSMDDCWASISPGWKLIDPTQSASKSVLLTGQIEEGHAVLIILRGDRKEVSFDKFPEQSLLFERALSSLANGSIFTSMSTNGMAVAAAIGDDEALRICNSAIASGAISAGISGSGPAIAVIAFEEDATILESHLLDTGYDVISTIFAKKEIEEVI
jgi:shikimate kinase